MRKLSSPAYLCGYIGYRVSWGVWEKVLPTGASLNWTPMGSKICPDYCGVHVSRFELYTGMHPALSICYEVVTVFQRLGLARSTVCFFNMQPLSVIYSQNYTSQLQTEWIYRFCYSKLFCTLVLYFWYFTSRVSDRLVVKWYSVCDKLCHCFSQSNNNMKPKEGEITSQPWQWPLNWQVTYMLATHALTHTHTHTHTYSYTHTHTHCLSHTYSHTHTHTICTHTLTHIHSHTHSLTHTLTLSLTHLLIHTHTYCLSHTYSHTHSHNMHTHTLSHTHTR